MKCIGNVAGGDRASWRVVGATSIILLRCGSPQLRSTQSHTPLYCINASAVSWDWRDCSRSLASVESRQVGGGGGYGACSGAGARSHHRPSTIDLSTSPATTLAGWEFLLLGRLGALTRPTQQQ